MKCLLKYLYLLLIVITNLELLVAKLNLFMSKEESNRLIGIQSKIYYVRDGTVNDYALKFSMPIPSNVSDLHFNWQSVISTPMPYSIVLIINDISALGTPSINITHTGMVPRHEQIFRISLPCNGLVDANIDLVININITMSASNVTSLTLKRNKTCLKGYSQIVGHEDDNILAESSVFVSTKSPFYILVGSTILFTFSFFCLVIFYYVRSHKGRPIERQSSYGGSSMHHAPSKQSQTFLKLENSVNPLDAVSRAGSGHNSQYSKRSATSSIYCTIHTPEPTDDGDGCSSKMSSSYRNKIPVERKCILLQECILNGTYSQIHCGILFEESNDNIKDVMIKSVTEEATEDQVSLFRREAYAFCNLNHQYILSATRICRDDPERPLFIYPYHNQENLKLFLQDCRISTDGHIQTVLTQDLVLIALQIIEGMTYLHKKRIIHSDLATRNCFISSIEGNSSYVKICDNSLSKDLFPEDYQLLDNNEYHPIKWLSIETLLTNEYTFANDVWEFGVTFWELMTLGQDPYNEINPFKVITYLEEGYRLIQPLNCPNNLYDIMISCWNSVPEERPSFSQLLTRLRDFYTALVAFI